VEWAILFSQTKSGVPRFPSWDWVLGLLDISHRMNLSAHLCGKWVSDVLEGNFTFFNTPEVQNFQRVQLNCGKQRLEEAFRNQDFLHAIRKLHKPVIIGGDYQDILVDYWLFSDCGMCPLFDASGGKGLLSPSYPKIVNGPDGSLLCGYAGGLGPDNILEQLERIAQVVGDDEVWLDMENNVRSDDKLDLGKVRYVLEVVSNWMSKHEN
jgi:hypothetical protein